VSLGINGAPLRDVSNFVNLGSTSHVNVAVARFDAWLLPFLNAYVMAGYVSNNTTTKGIVTIPPLTARGDPRTFKIVKNTELSGFAGGVGLTAAAGWRDFFILADFNFSQTDLGFENPFRALIGTVRSGWNGKVLDIPSVCGWEDRTGAPRALRRRQWRCRTWARSPSRPFRVRSIH
jgi:hypothetical protein